MMLKRRPVVFSLRPYISRAKSLGRVFAKLRGRATVRMTTEEIMVLTRGQ